MMLRNLLLGNKRLQKFWWFLYKVAIKGLNYDRGHVPSANGEEFAIRYVMARLQGKTPLIFDIGANRGQYFEMVRKNIRTPYRIYCFEPQASAFEYLEKLVKPSENVIIEKLGFSDRDGSATLYRNTEASEYASLFPADYQQYNVKLDIEEKIILDTVDNYCSRHAIDEIDLLKIDVEGYELQVLKGATEWIRKQKINFIQFEFGLAAIEARIYLKDFVRLLQGYDIYRILPSGLAPIHYTEYHELFLTTNYLAIGKFLKN